MREIRRRRGGDRILTSRDRPCNERRLGDNDAVRKEGGDGETGIGADWESGGVGMKGERSRESGMDGSDRSGWEETVKGVNYRMGSEMKMPKGRP